MKHNWEYKRLGDVCDFKSGYTPSSEELNDVGTIPYFKVAEMNLAGNECFLVNTSLFLNGEKRVFKKNSIVFPKNGAAVSTNKKRILFMDSVVDLNTAVVETFCGIDYKYLYHIFCQIDFKEFVKGGAIPTLNISMLKNRIIPVPSITDQKNIVLELDKINELIETRKEQLKELDNLAQSLFYDTFGDPITNPKGWEVKRIGDLTQVLTGATPSRDDASNFSGTIPWVKTTEVQNCDILSTEECISEDALKNTNCKLLPKNSILVAMYGQGRTRGQIARLRIEATTNQACAAILPSKNLKQSFLYEFLHVSYEPLRNLAIGCNQKNLNLKLIKDFFIILPPLSLQQQFAAQVEAIEAQKGVLNESLKELQTLLDSRMDYWFN